MHWDYNPFYWSSTITFFFYEKIPFNIKKIPEYGFRNFEFNASTYDQLGVKVDQSTFLQCNVYLIIFSMIRYMDCLTESFCNCPLSLTLSNAIRFTSIFVGEMFPPFEARTRKMKQIHHSFFSVFLWNVLSYRHVNH